MSKTKTAAKAAAPKAEPKVSASEEKSSSKKMTREQAEQVVRNHEGINGVEPSAELKQARAVLKGE